ncbi:MAG: hypothetical protein AUJ52_07770 [Elusimicrobia bacterium CG1_02_63_36]|nr:MAG: hypothetical protein AUJ52_07770 [Elusimicrobia bacterium CG1_02_63_36]PIP82035.1 MAG: hypothetical protein COR54_17145 [Elusimicrobia bacterium CG22_combo_CG10-13_8_21_14_all_63_91]PJA15361.1 MAG: DUF2891 domain-containing protein [Elusimicrobia bacterium CG_4_10_14_0_2_um_filter_63_34]PJB26954.1 MAG: DUF2891 domain-containing protein [Elusimicrobia bacterium CG_4_9_14_3_um_filter_62_55]
MNASVDWEALERAARLALDSVHREYPNHIGHWMNGDADAKTPREFHPAFYGCFDWHSAVHGHWLLARLARLAPKRPLAAEARAALAKSLTVENIAAEAAYRDAAGRSSFERPYGTAWLLRLAQELRGWQPAWADALEPLETRCVKSLSDWADKLPLPVRTGTHGQTAFAFGLSLDYARAALDSAFARTLEDASRRLFGADRDGPIGYEPSGHDFLSPCLAEADLMRRVLPAGEFAAWFDAFLPGDAAATLEPGVVTDKSDGQLAHWDGLNLSRAWMLDAIARALPEGDARRDSLAAASTRHRKAGLAALENPHYMGGHWLGSFAAYLLTGAYLDSTALP